MEGKGIFTWPDERKYEGDYYDDKKVTCLNEFYDRKDMEYFTGLMEESTKESGRMESNME